MDNELELDLNENNQEEIISRKDNRIKSLSDKVKTTSEERDAIAKAKEEAEAKYQAAQKEAEFYKSFNTVSTKYQGASEYQDKIREKAALGLDVEEATMLVLAKEGKYTPPAPTPERQGNVAGGSASIGITDSVEKNARDMSQAERKQVLDELVAKGEFKF